jgi:hypothetical protein
MEKLKQRSGDGIYFEDGKYPTDPKVIDKLNEIVEWINDHDQIIEYTPEDIEQMRKQIEDLHK